MHPIEREIAAQRREVAVLVDPDGREIVRREGSVRHVDLSDVPEALLTGNILIHNHPGGGSFSPEDVRFLITYRLAEIRAVDAQYRYRLSLPADTEWGDIAGLLETVEAHIRAEDRVAFRTGQATSERLAAIYWHKVWMAVADIRGWTYERQEHTE